MKHGNVSILPNTHGEMLHFPMSTLSGNKDSGTMSPLYVDTVSGSRDQELNKHNSSVHDASPMIPASVIAAIFQIESNPKLTSEEIKKKFQATGYEYADALAKYYIDKFAQEQKA